MQGLSGSSTSETISTLDNHNKENSNNIVIMKDTSVAKPSIVDDTVLLFHCDNCQRDITYTVRIRCAECADFDLCVDCFAKGTEVEGKSHKKTHSYKVHEVLDFPVYDENWGADEELILLSAIETYGLGNWEQIADLLPFKNRLQVAEHYEKVYINSLNYPDPIIPKTPYPKDLHLSLIRKEPSPVARPQPAPASKPETHEIQGYMPCRKEFSTEYDNEAEQVSKDLDFKSDDTEIDKEIKFAIIDIYNTALLRREERKKFVHDRGLLDYRLQQHELKQRSKEHQDLYNRMKVFTRMQTKEDFDLMMDGLVKELYLRQRIMLLQEARRFGLRTRDELNSYLKEKQIRYQRQKNSFITPIERSSSRYASRREDSNTPSEFSEIYYAPGTTPSLKQADSTKSSPSKNGNSSSVGTTNNTNNVAATIQAASTGQRATPQPLDVSNAEGIELLMDVEKKLCATLRIYPKAYMVIKETILREYAARGSLRRRQARELIKMDVNKTSRVYDFFVEMGWIKLQSR